MNAPLLAFWLRFFDNRGFQQCSFILVRIMQPAAPLRILSTEGERNGI